DGLRRIRLIAGRLGSGLQLNRIRVNVVGRIETDTCFQYNVDPNSCRPRRNSKGKVVRSFMGKAGQERAASVKEKDSAAHRIQWPVARKCIDFPRRYGQLRGAEVGVGNGRRSIFLITSRYNLLFVDHIFARHVTNVSFRNIAAQIYIHNRLAPIHPVIAQQYEPFIALYLYPVKIGISSYFRSGVELRACRGSWVRCRSSVPFVVGGYAGIVQRPWKAIEKPGANLKVYYRPARG